MTLKIREDQVEGLAWRFESVCVSADRKTVYCLNNGRVIARMEITHGS